MKKSFLIILFFSLLICNLSAASGDVLDSNVFYVKGYKINPDAGFEFVITDALNDSLNTVEYSGKNPIILTDYLGDYLGSLNNTDNIIFSFRLSGQNQGRCDIEFTFTPFTQLNPETGVAAVIDAAYTIDNLNFVFSESIPSNSGYKGVYVEDSSVGIYSDDINENVKFSNGIAESNKSSIKQPLHVNSDGSYTWIFRGAIKMSIDDSDFDTAPYGTYQAIVTAKLTVGE